MNVSMLPFSPKPGGDSEGVVFLFFTVIPYVFQHTFQIPHYLFILNPNDFQALFMHEFVPMLVLLHAPIM